MAGIISTMNEMSLSLQGKQLTVLVANHKIWAFRENLEFLKNSILCYELDNFLLLQVLSNEIHGASNKYDFSILCHKVSCIDVRVGP